MNSDPIAATKASAIHSADWNQMLFMKAVLSVRAVRHRLRAGRSRRGPTALLPRTRSSHGICGKYDCELRVQSGNRSIKFASVFDSEVRIGGAARLGELRNRTLALAAGVISSCERFRGTPIPTSAATVRERPGMARVEIRLCPAVGALASCAGCRGM